MSNYKPCFYAVNGSNAVGVFDYWPRARDSRKYVRQHRVKKFDTYEEAEAYALAECALDFPRGRLMPDELECNNLVFFKNCWIHLITVIDQAEN